MLTTTGFSSYLGELHPAAPFNTITFHFNGGLYNYNNPSSNVFNMSIGNTLQVTGDHNVKNINNQYVLAKRIKVGDIIGSQLVQVLT